MRMPSRRLVSLVLAILLVVGAILHWNHWYSPRARPGVLDPAGAAAALCATGGFQSCLWLPYPHQNLGALADSVGDLDDFLAALGRRGGIAPPRLLAFGPFLAPPAEEMSLAADRDGRRFAAVARLYPAMAVVARLAGRLAGNAWLAGGDVEVGGKPARVSWDGRLWKLQSADDRFRDAVETVPGARPGAEPALARLWLGTPVGPVPGGLYQLRSHPKGWAIEGTAAGGLPDASPLAVPAVAAVTLDNSGGSPRAAALFSGEKVSVPRAAVLFQEGGERWKLPGESLLTLGGRKMPEGERAGWRFATYDHASLEPAGAVAEALAPLVPAGASSRLARGLWLRPRPTRDVVRQVADILAAVPLFGQDEADRWRDYVILLAPLERFAECRVELGTERGAARLVLVE